MAGAARARPGPGPGPERQRGHPPAATALDSTRGFPGMYACVRQSQAGRAGVPEQNRRGGTETEEARSVVLVPHVYAGGPYRSLVKSFRK